MARRVSLETLYDPVKAEKGKPNIDVVLVHGIDGGPVKTWKDKSGVVWPQDLLPQDQPCTRVLSFGYNGDMYRNDSAAGIRDNARSLLSYLRIERKADPERQIVFIAHCLGGLIVKQALYVARVEKPFNAIFIATRGIVFFGTPHNGTDKDRWDHIAKAYRVFDRVGWGRRSALVEAMKRDSDALADVNDKFHQLADKFAITTFMEMRNWPGTNKTILEKADVEMESTDAEICPLDANHVEMCWFRKLDEMDFKCVCAAILKKPPATQNTGAPDTEKRATTTNTNTRLALAEVCVMSDAPPPMGGEGSVFAAGRITFDNFTAVRMLQQLGRGRKSADASGKSLSSPDW
ncbi:hypothetical protein DL765_004096 [Monosporascus sp. GIB2]|nr:hypothetical protein DL765_004096 [Monosporascus sp. GIB2]